MSKVSCAQEVMDRLQPFCAMDPNIARVAIFGSYARGEQRPDSDVDLLVLLDRKVPVSLADISKLKREFENLLESDVDVITSLTDSAPCFVQSVRRDGKVIYAR